MRLFNLDAVEDFKAAVDSCVGSVWLEERGGGSRFDLKSLFSQYIAIGNLISEQGENLELFCQHKEDESILYDFFSKHPASL